MLVGIGHRLPAQAELVSLLLVDSVADAEHSQTKSVLLSLVIPAD